jgi:shikimate kinase
MTDAAMRSLKASSVVAYIDRPLELLLRETETANRPLLAGGSEALTGLYEKRHALYEKYADICVRNDASVDACVEAILKKREEWKP